MNKLGINYCGVLGDSPEEFCRLIADLGFDAAFSSSETDAENFAKYAQIAGIDFECVHAPFKGINNIWLDNEEGLQMFDRLSACIDTCHKIGVPKTVMHLSSGNNPPLMNDLGFGRFEKLVEQAVKQNVILAIENQRKLGNIAHIHDNLCEPGGDLHMIPFDGKIDYAKVVKHLKDVNYTGTLTLEVIPNVWEGYKGITPENYYQKAYNAIAKIKEMMAENL